MADDALAGILGGISGGLQGFISAKRLKQMNEQELRDAQRDALALEAAQANLDNAKRDRQFLEEKRRVQQAILGTEDEQIARATKLADIELENAETTLAASKARLTAHEATTAAANEAKGQSKRQRGLFIMENLSKPIQEYQAEGGEVDSAVLAAMEDGMNQAILGHFDPDSDEGRQIIKTIDDFSVASVDISGIEKVFPELAFLHPDIEEQDATTALIGLRQERQEEADKSQDIEEARRRMGLLRELGNATMDAEGNMRPDIQALVDEEVLRVQELIGEPALDLTDQETIEGQPSPERLPSGFDRLMQAATFSPVDAARALASDEHAERIDEDFKLHEFLNENIGGFGTGFLGLTGFMKGEVTGAGEVYDPEVGAQVPVDNFSYRPSEGVIAWGLRDISEEELEALNGMSEGRRNFEITKRALEQPAQSQLLPDGRSIRTEQSLRERVQVNAALDMVNPFNAAAAYLGGPIVSKVAAKPLAKGTDLTKKMVNKLLGRKAKQETVEATVKTAPTSAQQLLLPAPAKGAKLTPSVEVSGKIFPPRPGTSAVRGRPGASAATPTRRTGPTIPIGGPTQKFLPAPRFTPVRPGTSATLGRGTPIPVGQSVGRSGTPIGSLGNVRNLSGARLEPNQPADVELLLRMLKNQGL